MAVTEYIKQTMDTLQEYGGSIATISGRFYSMDRDNRWERTQIGWEGMVNGNRS